jgi:hypothetical protein
MKSRVVLGGLAVIGIFTLSATVAEAGGGGTPSPINTFFVCHGITGDDPGLTVTVESDVFLESRPNARIGNSTLACAVAKLFRQGETTAITPAQDVHRELKCYNISVSRQGLGSPPPRYDITDELIGLELNVPVSSLQYICAPASLNPSP